MSPVIKAYIYIPIPILIIENPVKGVNFKWVATSKDPSRLSVSLYHWLRKPAGVPTAKLN
jgi:hypothetical protein